MRYFIFACLLVVSQLLSAETLENKIDALIAKQLPHATVGILVKDAKTGQVIYSKNADKLLAPASSIKLFTAAAALYQLKPDFYFSTLLAQKDHDVYLSFSGSPSLKTDDLAQLLEYLKTQNNGVIKGNIVLDHTRYKSPHYAGGVSYDDLGWYYTAPDTAIILNENALAYDFISAKKLGMPVQVQPKTEHSGLKIVNELVTVNKEEEKDHCNFNIEMKSNNTLRLYGCLLQNAEPKTMQLAIPNPVLFAKQEIQKILNKKEIVLGGKILTGQMPEDATTIASLQSKNLTQLVTHMLHESDNIYANSLTKQLAYALTKEGTYKQGAFAIKKILAEHTRLDMSQIELSDGMGTRYNLVTPEQMVVLLTDLYQDKEMQPIFLTALPQAGVSGTLKGRLQKTKLEKKVFAKTGTMHDISSLSGYLVEPNRTLIFSIMINGVNKPIYIAKSLEDQILLKIAEG